MTRAVVPISYSASGSLTALIAQAKDEPHRWWVRYGLASLLYTFLLDHQACLEQLASGRFDVATVVPSHPERRNGWDHLKELHRAIPSAWPTAAWDLDLLTKTGPTVADQRRQSIDPEAFEYSGSTPVVNRRVLLVDDLYTSGSTTASAAAALIRAGAQAPVVVTIGRHLNADDDAAVEFDKRHNLGARRWERNTCAVHDYDPWTSSAQL